MKSNKTVHDNDSKQKKSDNTSESFIIVDNNFTNMNQPLDGVKLGRLLEGMKNVMLPEVLKKLMKAKGINLRSLSKDCGIPVSTLSTYLDAKKATYDPKHLSALASFFNVTLDYLLFESEQAAINLSNLPTENVFEGWLKVKIERAVPLKGPRKGDKE